jgi:hypothetical protein
MLTKLKLLIFVVFIYSICTTTFSSCTKTVTNNDTTTIITRDTLISRDTVVTRDTVVIVNAKNPIVGLWVGTLTGVNEPAAGPLYYSFDIRSDSTLLTQSQGADGNTYYNQGTWSLSLTDSVFTAQTISTTNGNSGVLQTITAVYSKYYGTLTSGTWKNIDGSGSGTFSMKRIN